MGTGVHQVIRDDNDDMRLDSGGSDERTEGEEDPTRGNHVAWRCHERIWKGQRHSIKTCKDRWGYPVNRGDASENMSRTVLRVETGVLPKKNCNGIKLKFTLNVFQCIVLALTFMS